METDKEDGDRSSRNAGTSRKKKKRE